MKKLTKIGVNLHFHLINEKRIIYFHNEVDRYSVTETLTALEYLNGLNSKPIILKICSPGGSVDQGIVLYDYMKSSKSPIYTHCAGMAASMAAILLAAGKQGHRTVTTNSRVMIHQPSAGFQGKATDIEIHAKETARIKALLSRLISEDTKQPLKKVTKDMELDYWMTAEEALKYGIVDKIL